MQTRLGSLLDALTPRIHPGLGLATFAAARALNNGFPADGPALAAFQRHDKWASDGNQPELFSYSTGPGRLR